MVVTQVQKVTKARGWALLFSIFAVVAFPSYVAAQNRAIDSLKIELTQENNDSTQVETYIKLSRAIHQQPDDEESCLEYARAAVDQALLTYDEPLLARSLDNLGLLYRYHQNYEEAKELHIKAFELVKELDISGRQKAIYANNAGVASRYNTNYDVAVEYYLYALKLAEQEENQLSIEIACNGLGISMMNIPGMEKEALEYLEKALSVAIENNNELGQAMQYLSISNYYNKMENFHMAHTTLNQLMAINKERDDEHGMAMTYQQIGMTFERENLLQSALENHFEAFIRFEATKNETQMANSALQIATLYFKLNKLDFSLQYIEKSTALGTKMKNKALLMSNAFLKSELYEAQNHYDKALAYFKIGTAYQDSISMDEQATKMASLKRKYDFETKEREIELLSINDEIQKAELRMKDLSIVFMTILIILLIGLGIFGYRLRKTRREVTLALQLEEKAKIQAIYERNLMEAEILVTKMQVNPHFLFNCLNAVKYLIQSNENERALDYLLIFSKFIRGVLETSRKPTHTVTEELKLIEFYLKLERNRFDKDFCFSIDNKLEKWQEEKVLPSLLLQPLVENAIWHGLLPSESEIKRLEIKVWGEDDTICIEIDDFGVGRNRDKKKNPTHQSMGHDIIAKRIDLFNKSSSHQINWTIRDKVSPDGSPTGTTVAIEILVFEEDQVALVN